MRGLVGNAAALFTLAISTLLLYYRCQRGTDVRRTLNRMNSRRGHRFVLLDGGARAAADDRARVAHAAARRRRLSSDQSHDGLFHVRLDVRSGLLFRVA